jgi:hypothetical protein
MLRILDSVSFGDVRGEMRNYNIQKRFAEDISLNVGENPEFRFHKYTTDTIFKKEN